MCEAPNSWFGMQVNFDFTYMVFVVLAVLASACGKSGCGVRIGRRLRTPSLCRGRSAVKRLLLPPLLPLATMADLGAVIEEL